ncbi:MAG TPA: TonB-dependent receptor, partial [Steroidobacteraceae bacterium]
VQVVTAGEDVSSLSTPGVSGRLTIAQALQKLLSGTDLRFRTVGESTVALVSSSSKTTHVRGAAFRPLRVAVANESDATADVAPGSGGVTASGGERIELEEVVVTGSHIRGAQNHTSPVMSLDREEIQRSGYGTTTQLVRSLPQNLSVISDTTFARYNGGPGVDTTYEGTAINLRGLGSDATLILLNGRRMAAAGNGSFVDISLIPLSAIERVEVLTDGASALYGSDAVGGVVNVILRKDFTGAETSVRYGSVTEGSHDELQASQMLGYAWDSGRAFLTYEYFDRSSLRAHERGFFQPVLIHEDPTLIPEQTRHAAYAAVAQRLTDRIELSADFFYGDRDTLTTVTYTTGRMPDEQRMGVEQYGGVLGLTVDLDRQWQVRFSGALDQNESTADVRGMLNYSWYNESSISTVELVADGPLVRVPGGDVRLAVGGQYRSEEFEDHPSLGFPEAQLDRDISAMYAELSVPLVGQSNARRGIERLQLTVAGRYEDYSDFGDTFKPKIGLAWQPFAGLNVRGSWGESFKAPLLSQRNTASNTASTSPLFANESGELVRGMILWGNNADVGPEESKNWTLGVDYRAQDLPGLAISATYFNIDYTDRIRSAFPIGYDYHLALADPTYQVAVSHDPDPALVAEWLAHPLTECIDSTRQVIPCSSLSPSDIVGLVDARVRNISGVRMSGIDLSATYRFQTSLGDWSLQLNGTQLLRSRERVVPGTPEISAMNDVWRPVDLRLRSGASWSRGSLNVSGYVNYTDDYRDHREGVWIGGTTQRERVASWTTVDMTVQYTFDSWTDRGWPEATLALTGIDILNQAPPYVANAFGFFFDGVNAHPRGRFVSMQLTARW